MTHPPFSYFAYGSNMWRPRLEHRVGPVWVHGPAVLAGFAHRFNKLGADGTAKGNIVRTPGSQVYGVLYRLNDEQFEMLRRYEGGYEERQLVVLCSGEPTDAITYIAEVPRRDCPPPKPEYLAHYRRGIVQHGLPETYLAEILG